ncbi:DegT/DnrJ/EryC1/StrS family aminotransferase [Dethiothermospora halolimnae]|uniref:DegT/DnrJ/EryC1/StrS family aminotransferase n=1 Tax=Dethiothermospora halolimnae TaxID=3114390 RepID=UPI003CCC3368
MKIPLSKPDISQKEVNLVNEVLNSGWLSMGEKTAEFEDRFKRYFKVKEAISVNSGTSGLHLLIRALGIKEGDEVITTPFSFIASTNCILFEKATPVFVDIDPKTLNIDIDKIEEKITKKTKAILPVDIFGQPVNMERIMDIADKYNIKVIEDACEAIGGEYKGYKAGTLAHGSVFGFFPNKQITTGEGGMVITNDKEIGDLCRSMKNQGRASSNSWFQHERLGYNFRMSELNAALGVAQMDRLDEILIKRGKVAKLYNEKLKNIDGIKTPYIDKNVTKMSWFIYTIQVEEGIDRDNLINYLIEKGIGCKPYFAPIHIQPHIANKLGYRENDFPNTLTVSKRTIALPLYNSLKEEEIDYIVSKIIKYLKKLSR